MIYFSINIMERVNLLISKFEYYNINIIFRYVINSYTTFLVYSLLFSNCQIIVQFKSLDMDKWIVSIIVYSFVYICSSYIAYILNSNRHLKYYDKSVAHYQYHVNQLVIFIIDSFMNYH